jgi:hypothetical protein
MPTAATSGQQPARRQEGRAVVTTFPGSGHDGPVLHPHYSNYPTKPPQRNDQQPTSQGKIKIA